MNNMRLFIVALTTYFTHSYSATACDEHVALPLRYVSLWNYDAAATLDNLNQIDTLCKAQHYSSACLEKNLVPKLKALPVYSSPEGSQPFGALLTRFFPGEEVQVSYISFPLGGGNILTVSLDMFDSDWGYGPPYFHQTMLDSKNGWFKIALPSGHTKTGWIQLTDPSTIEYQKGDIISFEGKNYVILEVKTDSVLLRDEQPGDMWCDAGDPPPIKQFNSTSIPIKNLYDDGCHLQIKTVYTRGC